MPLVLGMNLDKDNEIWIDDLRITLDKIKSPTQTDITIHGEYVIEKKVINSHGWMDITHNAKMKLGTDTNRDGFCRVLVDAPKSVKIERGLLRNGAS